MSDIRDKIRSQVLGSTHAPKAVTIDFFGSSIEIRQPTLEDILQAQQQSDRKLAVAGVLINYSYVPGTDEKVFDAEDADVLLKLPFGPDYQRVTKALESLSEVNFLDGKDGSSETQPSSLPTESPTS